MSRDFGVSGPDEGVPVWVFFAGFIVLCAVGFAIVTYVSHRPRNLAQAEAWNIQAAPCPEVTREAFLAQPVKVRSEIEFGQMTVGRAFGHIECEDVSYGGWKTFMSYPACQLTGPGVLAVKAGGRQAYFLPGFGKRTTISMANGRLKCVLDGKFGKLS